MPSILIYLIVHGNLKKYSFPNLRLILFAGEVFPVKYLRELMQIIPHAGYYNLYGPTETNVCTWHEIPRTWSISRPEAPSGECRRRGAGPP